MTLHQLRIFLAVAKFRSFTQAADGLHLSQPDVSLHVRELEEEIGLNLFERVGKKIHLTQGGQVLREQANRIFAQLREAEQALAKSPAGAAQVQEFHRQLFNDSSDSMRQEIKRITGVEVREATVEVDSTTGTVVKALRNGTVVQVFLLADSVTAGTWSGNGQGDQS